MDEILDERSAAGEPEGYGYETENVALVNLTINPEKKKRKKNQYKKHAIEWQLHAIHKRYTQKE